MWPERIGTAGVSTVEAGLLIVVVGPSGAGKDSLLAYARRAFPAEPALRFVRRVVTRPADATAEDHDSLTPAGFRTAERQGGFAVTWHAHGLDYGVPVTALEHVRAGGIAVLNGSRAALPAIRAAFPAITVVLVTARPEIRAARLAGRQRESAEDVARRLDRDIDSADTPPHVIENNGSLEDAGERLVNLIRAELTRSRIRSS